jgi:hypothetical protein
MPTVTFDTETAEEEEEEEELEDFEDDYQKELAKAEIADMSEKLITQPRNFTLYMKFCETVPNTCDGGEEFNRLYHKWVQSDKATREIIDNTLIYVCGFSMGTLVKEVLINSEDEWGDAARKRFEWGEQRFE